MNGPGPGRLGEAQLAALAWLHQAAVTQGIDYWVFGGWAVDLHLGRVTRPHADVDVAVRSADLDTLARVCSAAGWVEEPDPDAEGWTTFVRGPVRMDLAGVPDDLGASDPDGGGWPAGSFGGDVAELGGARVSVVGRASLVADKSLGRDDPTTRAKDEADVRALLGRTRR